jgi:hypothetical protein
MYLENETLGKVSCKILSFSSTEPPWRSSPVSIGVKRFAGPCELFDVPDASINCSSRSRNGFSSMLLSDKSDESGDNPRCAEGFLGTINGSAFLFITNQY